MLLFLYDRSLCLYDLWLWLDFNFWLRYWCWLYLNDRHFYYGSRCILYTSSNPTWLQRSEIILTHVILRYPIVAVTDEYVAERAAFTGASIEPAPEVPVTAAVIEDDTAVSSVIAAVLTAVRLCTAGAVKNCCPFPPVPENWP
jgi:hypothetical protein